MGLSPKYRYFCPKWLTEICTFIIKCDTKLVRALSWIEGLTETGAPNPFICVRPRKREEWSWGGMGLQNATALSPLQTWPPQPSEDETHLMWSMHSRRRIQSHTLLCIYAKICYILYICTVTCHRRHKHTVSCSNAYVLPATHANGDTNTCTF